ncbi:MAG: Type 1 glutamine amidotransferase-like domain-containing protein [Eubacterium sp.]|nr:Type 1 glutamine amidotransferase-like domain-containing protein [Eubacterium sp.]
MKRLLLTSTGFSNKRFASLFLEKINKDAADIKVLFVPTAATDDGAREMLPCCYQDLTNVGILPENIFIYELRHLISQGHNKSNFPQHFRLLSVKEMENYDAVYFCGGDEAHLLNEVNRTGFKEILKSAVENGLFYIGASAGAVIAAKNLPNNLGFIKNRIYVHCSKGTPCGKLPTDKNIYLTDRQAVWIEGDTYEIIE